LDILFKEMIQAHLPKILLIRFSSFGDVTQALSIPTRLAELSPEHGSIEIHWIIREDLAPLLEGHPSITKVWKLDRNQGFWGLLKLARNLGREHFTHIYDAHNNMRSHILCWLLTPPLAFTRWFDPPLFLRKSQKRWKRFLLFKFRKNTYEMPFSGQRDLLEPLTKWGLSKELPPTPQIHLSEKALARVKSLVGGKPYVALAASAAYSLKRWPKEHFEKLIRLASTTNFVCLGGKEDLFIADLQQIAPDRVINLSGELSFQESTAAVAMSRGLIANDTGVLHLGEQLGKKTIALMGPAPFGFPSRPSTKILQMDLACRPCSKHGQGPCVNSKFQRCLVDISPEQVLSEMNKWF
jgi:ADP-heptose:LPS heptosyltransferase